MGLRRVMESLFRAPIGKRFGRRAARAAATVLAFALLKPSIAISQSESAAVSDAFYGVSKYSRKSLELSAEQAGQIESAKRQVLHELGLAGDMLKGVVSNQLGVSVLSGKSQGEILAHLERAPIFVCEAPDRCPCPAESSLACSQSREFGEGISLLLLVDPCLLSQNPGVDCGKSQASRSKKTIRGDLSAIRTAMAHGIYRLAQVKVSSQAAEAFVSRIRNLFADMAQVQTRLQAACGKRYPWAPSQLLLKSGHLAEVENPYVRECGRALVAPLFHDSKKWANLPTACKTILDEKRYAAWRSLSAPTIVRCDSTCAELTCREQQVSNEIARPMWLGRAPYLDVPQDSCDGPRPRDIATFLAKGLLPYLVKPEQAGNLNGSAISNCLKSLELPSAAASSTSEGSSSKASEWSAPILDLDGNQ